MGIARCLPAGVADNVVSYAGQPWSEAGSCASGSSIANLDDVSEDTITALTQGAYDNKFIMGFQRLTDLRKFYSHPRRAMPAHLT